MFEKSKVNNNFFIKLFKTPRCYYMYSVNKDAIVEITEDLYNFLNDSFLDVSILKEEDQKQYDYLIQSGYLSERRYNEIRHPGTDSLDKYLENDLNQLILQVTQTCNLSCFYCPYANKTNGILQRNHSDKHMTFEMAKKAVDFFIERATSKNEISVSFYGGEPIIAFDLIKSIVSYLELNAIGKNVIYTMTTNGTLLNDSIIDYLIKKQFYVIFSIDGPAEIHDKNRKRLDGSGSFESAFGNLKKMLAKMPNREHVSINMVLNPENNLDEVFKLFEDPVFNKQLKVQVSVADDLQLENGLTVSEEYNEKINYWYFLGALDFLEIVHDLRIPRFVETYYQTLEKESTALKNGNKVLSENGAPGGPCLPGVRRLFVSADGIFFPCEKVNELSDAMKIGTIDKGFDIDKAKCILNIASLTPEKCRNCWALLKCQICARLADDNGKLSANVKNMHCGETISYAEDLLHGYALINECMTVYKR